MATKEVGQQVRRREHRPRERDKGRERGERNYRERDQREGRDYQEDEHRPYEDEARRPFESTLHGSTTFLAREGSVMQRGSRTRGALASARTPA
jgi:hypothetical protein